MRSGGRLAGLVLAAALAASAVGARARAEVTGPGASATASASTGASAETGLSQAELEKMIAPLGRDSAEEQKAAAAALAALGPDAVPAIAHKLAELRKGGDGGMHAVVKGLRERSPHDDLLDSLVQLKPDAAAQRSLT